jgi:hypothetical protein
MKSFKKLALLMSSTTFVLSGLFAATHVDTLKRSVTHTVTDDELMALIITDRAEADSGGDSGDAGDDGGGHTD